MTNNHKQIDKIFEFIDQTALSLKKYLNINYQEALAENILNVVNRDTYVEDGFPTKEQADNLNQQYRKFDLTDYTVSDVKHAIDLAIIKAQNTDKVDVNHLMTPDVIGTISSLLLTEIFADSTKQNLKLMDPAVGTGNLLLTTDQQLGLNSKLKLQLYGIDNDDTMLALADATTQAIRTEIDLYHQDAVSDWIVNDFDLILTDLPVGYYPLDNNTLNFKTRAAKDHSYAHHLLMEQAMNNVHPNGIGVFIVPAQIFETDQAKSLAEWMVKEVYLQAVISLPQSLFSSNEAAKSIVVLQRKGDKAKQTPQVLMGQIPNLDNTKDVALFRRQLVTWSQQTFSWEA
ncbi:class I SAM-dependent methyltransferase [Bombilactobacillus thymidiniphilus]|uniref:Class I SAM-dependent methyltransferase n=1 Tax=Bombilactobacillus thymidiniphilus TaxID=2923363 RepID=A0ABY4PDV1_9LACO|nr:class I SAM-dependent methyltransferase [Bombilactobacillus thymidiniphilus]UQS83800.1 class I SAM-dependent methyltransferase [Bombilactobacillus thymidiniphilus]